MPRKYKRKSGVVPRQISWTEETLALAFKDLDKKRRGINEVSRFYGIPSRTLRRRYEQKNQQTITQGNHPVLGFENEKMMVAHILKLADAGIPLERSKICQLAYEFAEKLGLKHNFNNETKSAGPQWLRSFLDRNPEIVLRHTDDLLIERTEGVNRIEVANFSALTENDMQEKPETIFIMDESDGELNNQYDKVLTKKDTRKIKSRTSGEKEETITGL